MTKKTLVRMKLNIIYNLLAIKSRIFLSGARLVFLVTVLFIIPVAHSQTLLVVGEEFAPFEFIDRNGKVVGIDVDIATYIFKKLGIEFEVKLFPWSRAWSMAETGEADAILSTSRKDKRKSFLFYPEENMWVSEYVFFNNSKHILPSLTTFDDVILADLQIGTIRGNSYNNVFWETFPNEVDGSLNRQLQAVTNIDLNFKKLARERIDLFLADRTVGLFTVKKMGLRHLIETEGHPLFSKGYPMPFVRKSNYPDIEKVSKSFERELVIIKNNGIYQKIFNKWVR